MIMFCRYHLKRHLFSSVHQKHTTCLLTGLQCETLTGAGGVLRLHLCVHVRWSMKRLQVHILRLWQHLQKGRLAVKRVYSLWSQQTHTDPETPVSEGRPGGQDVRPVRQSLQRPPRCRRRLLVEAEQLLDPKAGAPVHRGGHLPDWMRLLGSPVVHAGLWGCFLFIFGVWKHNSLLPCHGGEVPLFVFCSLQKSLVQWALWWSFFISPPASPLRFLSSGQQAAANHKRGKTPHWSLHQLREASLNQIIHFKCDKMTWIFAFLPGNDWRRGWIVCKWRIISLPAGDQHQFLQMKLHLHFDTMNSQNVPVQRIKNGNNEELRGLFSCKISEKRENERGGESDF